MKTKKIKLNCRFCGKETGYFEIKDVRASLVDAVQEHKNHLASIKERAEEFAGLQTPKAFYEQDKAKERTGAVIELLNITEKDLAALPEIDTREEELLADVHDTRCTDCETEHGSYKQMHDEIVGREGISHEHFEAMMKKTGFKKDGLQKLVDDHKKKHKVVVK